MSFRVTVYGRPQPAGSKRAFVNHKTGKAHVVDDAKGSRPWKQEVAGAARNAMTDEAFDCPIVLHASFYLRRPKGQLSASGGVKASSPNRPAVRPDATKLLRAIEDAMTGIVYRADAQIVSQAVDKFYAAPDEPERVEIEVYAA